MQQRYKFLQHAKTTHGGCTLSRIDDLILEVMSFVENCQESRQGNSLTKGEGHILYCTERHSIFQGIRIWAYFAKNFLWYK